MACARNLKALIIFWVNRWKLCWVFNYRTKFQTICISLSPLTIHANLHFILKNQLFACLIMPLPNLHMSAICKLGKGINLIKHAKGWFFREKWIVKGLKLKQIVWNFVQKPNTFSIYQLKIWLKLLNFVRKPFLFCWKDTPPWFTKFEFEKFFSWKLYT
jgi:hypothetical protein